METRVNISFKPSNSPSLLGNFTLSFTGIDGNERTVGLKFDPKQLWGFSRDTSSIAFDFLILAFIVYNVDRAINRQLHSVDGWRREIVLENVPAVNLASMNRGRDSFVHAINFLTGDSWDINFIGIAPYVYQPSKNIQTYNVQQFEKVALFSGGLDSLIGFINEASTLADGKKMLLISHMELGKEHKDQEGILSYCKSNNIFEKKYNRLLLNAGLRQRSWNIKTPTESTFRARSLLFFAAGIYVAHHIGPHISLIIPENGTISINIPLDKGRRSACSTRTTHPTFIKRLEEALMHIGIHNTFVNPYQYKSKADMMVECNNDPSKKSALHALTLLSCSCAKRGHNSFWDKTGQEIHDNRINHCGMCLPCLYRRVALDAIGLDSSNLYGTDVLHGVRYNLTDIRQKRNRDFRALLFFIRNRMNEKIIKKELMMNGITDPYELKQYVDLAMHSYEQIKHWISMNATPEIKQIAGI